MIRVHELPAGEATRGDFQVSIEGRTVTPYFARVSAMPYNTVWPGCQRPLDQTEEASFVSFEADQPVLLSLTADRYFSECVVRPLSKRITPVCTGRSIALTIPGPGAYTVELDGFHHALHIFCCPVREFGVDKTADNVLYFGPGVHHVGHLEVGSGQTVWIDGGAVVYGSITAVHARDVHIVGYGVLDGSEEVRTTETGLITWDFSGVDFTDEAVLRRHLADKRVLRGCIRLYSCQDCSIEGVICRDAASFAVALADCVDTRCDGVKTIGMWRYNSDGIDLFNCRRCVIERCFLRDFDDCIVLKGIKGWDRNNMEEITVRGCTVWCDWGRALEIGAETCADEYRDILFEDCDVLHGSNIQLDLQIGDRARVRDVVFRNIRCEYSRFALPEVYQKDMAAPYTPPAGPYLPRLLVSQIYDGPWSDDHLLGSAQDVRFEDIQVLADPGLPTPRSEFMGADETHCNRGFVIDGLYVNGVRQTRLEQANVVCNDYTYDTVLR